MSTVERKPNHTQHDNQADRKQGEHDPLLPPGRSQLLSDEIPTHVLPTH
jgi:hypothetical protein